MAAGIDEIRKKILPILKSHEVKKAGIFGSFARGDASGESDIDILVDIPGDISLLDFIGLKLEIEDAIGKKVDLVEYDTIKPAIRKKILDEQTVIL